jgi:hypothetical protein
VPSSVHHVLRTLRPRPPASHLLPVTVVAMQGEPRGALPLLAWPFDRSPRGATCSGEEQGVVGATLGPGEPVAREG